MSEKHVITLERLFTVGDYIWPREWKNMCACRQFKIIHITETGYIVKQVDHRGRLWKKSQEISLDWEDNYEVVPDKYIRKLEHKFDYYDTIFRLDDKNKRTYTVTDIMPDFGYKLKVDDQLSTYTVLPFNDEPLFEKIENIDKDISVDDRKFLATAELVYLNTEGYKLEETYTLSELDEFKKNSEQKDKSETGQEPKYDISRLNSGDQVLVRVSDAEEWRLDFFSHISKLEIFKFVCVGGNYPQCIPIYYGNRKLIGTTNMPDDYFIVW